MTHQPSITIEGFTADDRLAISDEQPVGFGIFDQPVVFRIGSAEVLGEFSVQPDRLRVELAHIDGGGEGVLPTLSVLLVRFAKRRGLSHIEWVVFAAHCANPNPRLRHVLRRKGFSPTTLPDHRGEVYFFLQRVDSDGTFV